MYFSLPTMKYFSESVITSVLLFYPSVSLSILRRPLVLLFNILSLPLFLAPYSNPACTSPPPNPIEGVKPRYFVPETFPVDFNRLEVIRNLLCHLQ